MSTGTRGRPATAGPAEVGTARRWAMLGAGTGAQAAAAVATHGPAFLIPALHAEGLGLPEAGLYASAPLVGVMLALVAWGVVVDRVGERVVLLGGLALTTLALGLATRLDGVGLGLALLVAGAAAASANAASGRVVVGWFPPERRGLAMGIRQMGQPVGVGVGAATMAALAAAHGVGAALAVPALATGLALVAVALVVLDPPRPDRRTAAVPHPYRSDGYLARVHGVSMLLVVPQFVVWTFALAWLVQDRGWAAGPAGAVVAGAQVAGALGRIGAGWLSDVARSRLRPLRWVAVAAAGSMALLGAAAGLDLGVSVVLVVVATTVTVADNGLAFTAVAERAGAFWSGRALGAQNTAQYLAAAAVPPVAGATAAGLGYPATFALAALFPLLALPLVPVRGERPLA